MRTSSAAKPATVAQYLTRLPVDQRRALRGLRASIRAAIPRAEECISYQMPAYRLDGKMIVWFGAAKSHCAFYPGAVTSQFREELRDFTTSKGTIRFQPDSPIPPALVRKLVKARAAQVLKKPRSA